MEEVIKSKEEVDAEEQARVDIWQYVYGFTPTAVVKCAIQLRIADVLESHGGALSLADLSSALACSPSALRRIMRYLIHRGFFKQESSSSISYAQTPLSRLLCENGVAALVLTESSPAMIDPWHQLSSRALLNGASPFQSANGEELWEYGSQNPAHTKLFNEGMGCHAGLAVADILRRYGEVFEGIGCLVDVGGGNGTALRCITKACPWVRGINFDLPHVVSEAPSCEGVEHVGGDMFQKVPKADAAFLMWVLHDWSDEECVEILSRCREAVPEENGRVIIVEAVIVEGEEDKYSNARLTMDMVMMAHTEKGKERSLHEWEAVVKAAGFSRYTVKHIDSMVSVIEAYP